MPSRRRALACLARKEFLELFSSRAFWVMLLLTGPLVGVSFISAVTAYGELSAAGGSGAGVGEAFSPLIGVFGPTFSAYEIVAAFLLPFVAIRMVSADRMSGAAKLEAQQPQPALARVSIKALVLLAGWMLSALPGVLALILWRSYGASIHMPEIAAIVLGHLLNAGLTVALAACAASVAEHPATAAILTLAFTVGTWVLDFVAAVHGGIWVRLVEYTPPAIVAQFQHGLVRLDVLGVVLACIVTGLVVAAEWMQTGVPVSTRAARSLAVAITAAGLAFLGSRVTPSFDLSENRYNSFSIAEEAALRRLPGPLSVEARLAPSDPRRYELERRVLGKLMRVRPDTRVVWSAETSTGLFEQAADRYGEVWYELAGRRVMSRDTSPEGVLETLFTLADVTVGGETEPVFRGHPLAARPTGAATLFHLVWPALVLGAGLLFFRSQP